MNKKYLKNLYSNNKIYILKKLKILIFLITELRAKSLWEKIIKIRKIFLIINIIVIFNSIFKIANVEVDIFLIMVSFSCFFSNLFSCFFTFFETFYIDSIFNDIGKINLFNKIIKNNFLSSASEEVSSIDYKKLFKICVGVLYISMKIYSGIIANDPGIPGPMPPEPEIPLEEIEEGTNTN